MHGPELAYPAAAETLFIVCFGSGGTSLSVDGDVHLVRLDFWNCSQIKESPRQSLCLCVKRNLLTCKSHKNLDCQAGNICRNN